MPRSYKKKSFKKRTYKKKTSFTRRKINRGVPRAVMMSETKIKKDILNLDSPANDEHIGSFYCIPYCQNWSSLDTGGNSILNPDLNDSVGTGGIPQNLGNFITNGDFRDQRNGRRITMLNAHLDMIFHFRSKGVTVPGDPPTTTYKYPMNPELRVIQGWIKGGIDSMPDLDSDIPNLYAEINYSRYKVMKDFIISRRAISALGAADPASAASYAPIKLKFDWKPNRRITFDNGILAGAVSTEVKYNGWVPFIYIRVNTEVATDLVFKFDKMKRTLVFKDL